MVLRTLHVDIKQTKCLYKAALSCLFQGKKNPLNPCVSQINMGVFLLYISLINKCLIFQIVTLTDEGRYLINVQMNENWMRGT